MSDSDSTARQMRKLAAALRKEEHTDAVSVNAGTDEELRKSLAGIPGFRLVIAERIIEHRPFTSKSDMLQRVNEGILTAQSRLGPKWMPYLHIAGSPDDRVAWLPLRRGPKRKAPTPSCVDAAPPTFPTHDDSSGRTGHSGSQSEGSQRSTTTTTVLEHNDQQPDYGVAVSCSAAELDMLLAHFVSNLDGLSELAPFPEAVPAEAASVAPSSSFVPTFPPSPPVTLSHAGSRPASHVGNETTMHPAPGTADLESGARAGGGPPAATATAQSDGAPTTTRFGMVRRGCSRVGAASRTSLLVVSLLVIDGSAFTAQLMGLAHVADCLLCARDALCVGTDGSAPVLCEKCGCVHNRRVFQVGGEGCRWSSVGVHRELWQHTLKTTRPPMTCALVFGVVHFSMLSLAMIFDWQWYPQSTGSVLDWVAHAEMHSLTLLIFGMLFFLRSHLCTAWTYQWVMCACTVVAITICTRPPHDRPVPPLPRPYSSSPPQPRRLDFRRAPVRPLPRGRTDAFPKTEAQLGRHGCSRCASDALTYTNRTSGQTIAYDYPAQPDPLMRLYGLVLKQRPHPSNDFSLGMAEGLERWLLHVIESDQSYSAWSSLYILLVALLSPFDPIPTALLTGYTAGLRWWRDALDIHWSFDGMHRACCQLTQAPPFMFAPVLVLLFLLSMFRQYCAICYVMLKRQQTEMALLRIEQLHREKERLDYERQLYAKHACIRDHVQRLHLQRLSIAA